MTNQQREKISDKIKKLLALAQSDNQHESELAMKRANELMKKHQIEEAELLVHVSKDEIAQEFVSIDGKRRQWVTMLAWAASKVFDCDVVQKGGGYSGTNFIVFGRPEDIKSTKFLFNHLFKSWHNIVEHDFEVYKTKNWGDLARGEALRYRTSHGGGYAQALLSRAVDMVKARNAELKEVSDVAALVPVNTALAVKNKIKADLGKLGKSEGAALGNREALSAGLTAGKSIPLGGAISGNAGYIL